MRETIVGDRFHYDKVQRKKLTIFGGQKWMADNEGEMEQCLGTEPFSGKQGRVKMQRRYHAITAFSVSVQWAKQRFFISSIYGTRRKIIADI